MKIVSRKVIRFQTYPINKPSYTYKVILPSLSSDQLFLSHPYLQVNYSSPILIFRSILPHSAIFFIFPHLFRLFLPLQLSHTSNLNYLSICPPFSTPTLITPLSDFTTLPSPPPLPHLYHLFILSCPISLTQLPLFPPSSHLLPHSFPFSPCMTLPDFKPVCPSHLTLPSSGLFRVYCLGNGKW